MKRTVCLFMLVLCFFMALSSVTLAVDKGYPIENKKITVYKDANLTNPVGTISPQTECTLDGFNEKSVKLKIGNRTYYAPTKAFLLKPSGWNWLDVTRKTTTYIRPNGPTYGYMDVNDFVFLLGLFGDWVQVDYPAVRNQKYAFIKRSDFNLLLKDRIIKQTSYSKIAYGQDDLGRSATVSSGGCGIVSLMNAVRYLTNQTIPIERLVNFALKTNDPSGIKDCITKKPRKLRYSGGTSDYLTKCFCNTYGSTYGVHFFKSVSSLSDVKNYLIEGGYAAVVHVSGHFIALVDYNKSTGQYLILDSYPSKNRKTSNGYRYLTAGQFTGKMALSGNTSTPIHIIKRN